MKLFRISKEEYAGDLSGRGAELHGGRWNSAGNRMVYCSTTAALALLETLAWSSMANLLSAGFVMMMLECPDDSIESISIPNLGENWNTLDAYPMTQRIGDNWLKNGNTLLLRVPSAVLPMESNVLINPMHEMMSGVEIVESYDLRLDQRLLKSISS